MENLNDQNVTSITGHESPLSSHEIETYLAQVPDWQVIEADGEKRLRRQFTFKNFAQALQFTDRVGHLAEQQDHHPALLTEWGKVTVDWWTHKIHGLHRNDFIMAAKTDQEYH